MTKQEKITTAPGIAVALAAAQMEMGKALKQSNNPHFRSKYADLGNVMDACLEPLNRHGIAVVQPTGEDDHGRHVKTVLIHGESGETLECVVPLIIQKNDMQGYGSAVTYARRYGLMAMAGIAPEDDDGNGAAKARPKTVTAEQFVSLRDMVEAAGADIGKFLKAYNASDLEQFPADRFEHAMAQLCKKVEQSETENV